MLAVFEQLRLFFGESHGAFQMAQFELRFVEIQQRLGEQGVIVQEAGDRGIALRGSGAAEFRSRSRTGGRVRNSAARRAASA